MRAMDAIPRTPSRCVLPCTDAQGQDGELTLVFSGRRLTLTAPHGGKAVLSPLQVERVRAALRDLLLDVDPGDYL